MKVLALGDTHGHMPKNLNSIVRKNKIELIISSGDPILTPKDWRTYENWISKKNNHNKTDKMFEHDIRKLSSYNIPVFLVKGNCFTSGEGLIQFRRETSKYNNMIVHRVGIEKKQGLNFIFFDITSEPHAYRGHKREETKANKRRNQIMGNHLNKLLSQNPNAIVISHAPPYGHCDQVESGKHVGSKILLKAIKKHKPQMVLCGHIHEAKGESDIGNTKIYNLGYREDYRILEL